MFATPAGAYDRFMGRWSRLLSPQLADLAMVAPGQRVLDVGCGPGALLTELVERLGVGAVAGVDPSESYVAAARERLPGVDVRVAPAEHLPLADHGFDAALAQLVVHFMADPVAGLREMARVTRSGGVVAACVWDYAGHQDPLRVFWAAAAIARPGRSMTSRTSRVFARGILRSCSRPRGSRTSSPRRSWSNSSSPTSMRGGSPSPRAWARPAPTCHGWSRTGAMRSARRPGRSLPDGPFVLDARAWAARGVVA